ncbi:MAG: large conductance mechanosensitive channel protein MscL [Williamsia sp.]|nr:large conductance mechanosensitive channel protein MscL [Williamsia sp.]
MLQEFKEFAIKGNVLDLAVGVIIGAAFGGIVTSVVDNILMPIIGMLIGGFDIKSKAVEVGTAKLQYGMFLQATINFIIIAFFLFLVVKAANNLKAKKPVETTPTLSPTEVLLTKISEDMSGLRSDLKNTGSASKL